MNNFLKINNVLNKLDIRVIIQDIAPDYKPNKKGIGNISCLFAEDRHGSGKDTSKSMTINDKGEVFCHACGYKATNIIWFFKDILKIDSYEEAAKYLIDKYVEPLVDLVDINAAHTKLMHSPVMIERLKKLRGFNIDTIKKYKLGLYRDKITIPIINEYGFFCNIRLYDLLGLSKIKIMSFKEGYGSAKLFPYTSFDNSGPIYLFEGETDCILALQNGLNAVTTTGGAATWKSEWDEYFNKREIIIVPDIDKAGLDGCNKRIKALAPSAKKISIIKLPIKENHKDFTDYMIKEKHSIKDFLKLPKESFDIDDVYSEKEDADDIKTNIKTTSNETTYLNNSEYIFQKFNELGGFFKDQNLNLFFTKNDGQTFPVKEKNQNFLSELTNISPFVNSSTTNGKFIIQYIKNKAFFNAKEVKSGSWTLLDKNNLYIYLNKFNGKILKINNEGVSSIIKNGVNEDCVLLEYPDMITTLEVHKTELSEAFNKLKKYIIDNIAMSIEDTLHLLIWFFATFFRELVNARPIIRLEASTAFGKSTVTKILSTLLYGQEFLQHASTIASIYTVAAKVPLLMFDNIETRNMTSDFQDFLLIASTGGSRIKRQLHTDTGFVKETANCMVLTNGIEPYSKNEIISRTLMLKVDVNKFGKRGFNLSDVLYKITSERDDILIPILKHLCKKIFSNKDSIAKYACQYGKHSKERFNDFYGLARIILEAFWPYIDIEGLKGYSPKELINVWLNKQTKEHNKQTISVNDVCYYFNTLAIRHKALLDLDSSIKIEGPIIKIKGQVIHLLSDFRILAKQLGIKCPWESHKHLAARIQDSIKILEKDGWEVYKVKSCGRVHYVFKKETKSLKSEKKETLGI